VPVLGRALLCEVLEGGVQRHARGGGVVDVQGDVLGSQAARAFQRQLEPVPCDQAPLVYALRPEITDAKHWILL
jgi:hypothetical protein